MAIGLPEHKPYKIIGDLSIRGQFKIIDPDGHEVKNIIRLEIILDAQTGEESIKITTASFKTDVDIKLENVEHIEKEIVIDE